jgi:DNA polymerase-3 subunit epsilon
VPGPPATSSALTFVPLQAGDTAALIATLPAVAGVAQFLGPEGQSLLIGRPSNLRRWAATQLGAGKPPKKGMRPPTNLAPITSGVGYVVTSSPFAQRLAYERLMGRYVPLAKRRDLKPPVYLHLDPAARFPRLTVRPSAADRANLFGPFRSRQAAQAAIEALHQQFPLRPCDYTFEPAVDLALGLGCVFAQIGTCAAPCLVRTSE